MGNSGAQDGSDALPNTIRRYGRLKICATAWPADTLTRVGWSRVPVPNRDLVRAAPRCDHRRRRGEQTAAKSRKLRADAVEGWRWIGQPGVAVRSLQCIAEKIEEPSEPRRLAAGTFDGVDAIRRARPGESHAQARASLDLRDTEV